MSTILTLPVTTDLACFLSRVDAMLDRFAALGASDQDALRIAQALLAASYDTLGGDTSLAGRARFEELRAYFQLSDLACDVLWLLLAPRLNPDLQARYQALLWPHGERSRLNIDELQRLVDPEGAQSAAFWDVMRPGGTLRAFGLITELVPNTLAEAVIPFAPSQRLVLFLQGVTPEPLYVEGFEGIDEIDDAAAMPAPDSIWHPRAQLSNDTMQRIRAGFEGARRFLLVGTSRTGPERLARELAHSHGRPLIHIDMAALSRAGLGAARQLLAEAFFRDAGLYWRGVDALAADDAPAPHQVQALLRLLAKHRGLQFFQCDVGLEPSLRLRFHRDLNTVVLPLRMPPVEIRRRMWREVLAPYFSDSAADQLAFAMRTHTFDADAIAEAMSLAQVYAYERQWRAPRLSAHDVVHAARRLARTGFGERAQRVEVAQTWDDLVLAPKARDAVNEILRFGRQQRRVFDDYGYGGRQRSGRSLHMIFMGPPGTGKTMLSGLIARELGYELYRVSLAGIMSKYIGETQKHLARIFDESAQQDTALLFDEADSLFAERTQVKSSTDRYANLDVNFLLERLEAHPTPVILTTNLPGNIDDAFLRRLRFKISLDVPGPEERAELWRRMIPQNAPHDPELPFEALGEVYELSGAEIRNAVIGAAVLAADDHDCPLGEVHLEQAAQHEIRGKAQLVTMDLARWRRLNQKPLDQAKPDNEE